MAATIRSVCGTAETTMIPRWSGVRVQWGGELDQHTLAWIKVLMAQSVPCPETGAAVNTEWLRYDLVQ